MVASTNYSSQHGATWAKVPAMRHAMARFPQASFFFYLDPHVLIRNHGIAVEKHVLEAARLESLMIAEVPIVPPDSVIKTFKNLRADSVDLIMTQDFDGLSVQSFIVRRGDWAKYFLDAWYDPLYRTYNFQRADRHALEHIIQWVPWET
jgi:mannan polymerase II complex MNN11 subunit